MYRINQLHIDKFIKSRCEYLYPISKGIYLAFHNDDLEYIGIELFYIPKTKKYEKQADKVISDLLAKDLIEYV